MIKRPKKQLYSSQNFLAAFLLLPLVGFFIYATCCRNVFFLFLILALTLNLIFLFFFRVRLIKKQAEIDLQRQDCLEKVNLLEAEIHQERQTIESFHKKVVNYSQLKDLVEQLCVCFSLEETAKALTVEVNNLFSHKDITVILYLFHSQTGELGIVASKKGRRNINIKDKKGDIYDQWVIKTMKPLLIEDTKNDFRFDIEKIKKEDPREIRSLISIPLVIGSKSVGILRLDTPCENYFGTEDTRLLTTIGDLGAIAIENAQLYDRIEDLAIKDSLTGLFLRRHFLDRFSQEISRELRLRKELSFLMIDLDHFKQYNDSFGHTAGDIVLRAVGTFLMEMFNQPGESVCRYGGEEFAVLLPDCSKKESRARAEVLRKRISEQTILLRREKTKVTVSIGIASFPEDAQIKEDLIQKADMALYQAKKKGRNRVESA